MKKIKTKWKVIAAAVAVVSLIIGWYFTLRPGIYVNGDFYYRVNGGKIARNSSEYILKTGENSYYLVSYTDEKSVEVTENGDHYTFSFSDGETLNLEWNGWYYDDGSHEPFEITVYTNNSKPPISKRTYALSIIEMRKGNYESISHWFLLLLGLFIYCFGVVSIWFPEEMHFLFSRWQYQNAELSDAGILVEKIGGIALCVLGVLTMTGIILAFMA